MNNFPEALENLLRANDLILNFNGEFHENTALSYNNLGVLCFKI